MKIQDMKFIAVAACATLIIPGSLMATQTLPFADSFDTFSATGNYSTNGGGIVQSQSGTVLAGAGASALLVSNDTVTLSFGAGYDNAWIQVYAKPVAGSADPSVSGVSGAFYVKSDGTVRVYDGAWADAGSVTVGNWVGFIVHVDYVNDKWDLYTTTGAYLSTASKVASELSGNALADLEEFSVQSGDAGYIDGLGAGIGGEAVSATSPNRIAVISFFADLDLAEFVMPIYAGAWTNPTSDRALGGRLGAALSSGLVQDDEIHVAGDSTWFWNQYVIDFNGDFLIGAATPSAPPVASALVFENTRLLINLDDARSPTFGFFPYDTASIQASNGQSTGNASGTLVNLNLLGTGNNTGGFTAFEWNETTAFGGLPFGSGVGGGELLTGDRLFIAHPNDPTRYTEYWWNGSWQLFASAASGNVPAGAKCWMRRVNSVGSSLVSYTRP